MDKSKSLAKENEEVIALYNFWLDLIPWDTPALKPYEAEKREAQPYMIGGKFRSVENFCKVMEWETTMLLQQAKYDIPNAANQSEILAGLKETQNIRANSFREWEKRKALEPERGYGDEAEEHLRITYGELKRRCEEREKRDKFLKECKSAGVEVAVWPGATIEKMVAEKLNVWIDDNIKYLEGMGVQPRRAGEVEVKQTAEICALVYTIDRAATGETVPSKTGLVQDIKRNYPQFRRDAGKIYRLISTREATVPPKPTGQDCRRIAGNDWQRVVVALSNHPDKVKEYIENVIIKR